jgi:hypothetical protein
MAALKKVGFSSSRSRPLLSYMCGGLSPRMPSPQESAVSALPGPLCAFHAERPGIRTCSSCHDSRHPGRQEECLACHSKDGWRIDQDPVVKW